MKNFLICFACVSIVSVANAADVDSYEKILSKGSIKECVALAKAFYEGVEAPKDFEKAARLYHKAAAEGSAEAQYRMSLMYSEGAGLKERPDKAYAWAFSAAKMGHAEARNLLGVYYSQGYGVERDDRLAVEWFEKGASKGNAKAQFNLGASYEFGTGVQKDPAKAVMWYSKSAEQGCVAAQYSLGTCYEFGIGAPVNPGLAAEWYSKAASQGDPRGQLAFGVCLELGKGAARNPALATAWYREAADQGYTPAQLRLAQCYEKGIGVPVNQAAATEFYRRASLESGDQNALLEYAMRLETGKGVAKNEALARTVYATAVTAGVDRAQQRLFYLDRDEPAAVAAAEAMKSQTVVFKGLYLGMPIQDAATTLEKRLREVGGHEMLFVTEEKGMKVVKSGVEIEITADANGHVNYLYLSNKTADRLFDTTDSPNPEFIRTFVKACGASEAVLTEDNQLVFSGKKPVGNQKRHVYRAASGYELVFYDSYAFSITDSTRNCMATGACKPIGSFSIRKIASDEERAAKFN